MEHKDLEKFRTTYIQDADGMVNKRRWGYFSVLPSHTAGITDFKQKNGTYESYSAIRAEDGRVLTKDRNILAGASSSGTLKKSYFCSENSVFVNSAYEDPGKLERQKRLKESRQYQDKEVYKPAINNKSLLSSAYPYECEKPDDKTKNRRGEDGRVITESPNILTNPPSKISSQMGKICYKSDPYDNALQMKIQDRKSNSLKQGDEPFKTGNRGGNKFANNIQNYFDGNVPQKKMRKSELLPGASHDSAFIPSCRSNIGPKGLFNKFNYKEQGVPKKLRLNSLNASGPQCFKLLNKHQNSKPTPSISCSKMNLMRCLR